MEDTRAIPKNPGDKKAMEDSHLSQMVSWLDEEQRKSKTELLSLQQWAESQETELKDWNRRLQALETQQASLQAQLARIQQLEQALEQLKSEVVLLINKSEERQRHAEREAERIRQIAQENQARTIGELKKELEKLRQIEDNIAMLRAEDRRLGETVQKTQQEFTELRKQGEASNRATTYLEELGKRNETQIANTKRLVDDLKREQAHALEDIQLREQARQRRMTDWEQEVEAYRKETEEYRARMQLYAEQHERGRRALDTLQEFKEQMEREQHQVAELQRLGEERQRTHLEEWHQEEEKRRQEQQMHMDHQLAEQIRNTEKHEKQIAQLQEQTKEQGRLVAALLQAQEELAQINITTAREWQVRFEELVE